MKRSYANGLTFGNLVSGWVSLFLLRKGRPSAAVMSMIIAGVFDVLDGWAAKRAGTANKRGSIIDSLADMSSFGIVPALMLTRNRTRVAARITAVLYAAAISFRLIRFNRGGGGEGWFNGMPSPATAIAVTGGCAFVEKTGRFGALPPLVALVFAGLAVSTKPYGKITHPSLRLLSRPVTLLMYGVHGILFLVQPGLAALSLMIVYAVLGPSLMREFKRREMETVRAGVISDEGDR